MKGKELAGASGLQDPPVNRASLIPAARPSPTLSLRSLLVESSRQDTVRTGKDK